INKMDKVGANFAYAIETLNQRLGVHASPIQWPIGAENDFTGIIDLIELTAFEYDNSAEENGKNIEIPEHLKEIVEIKRNELIEVLSNLDEELMMLYLEEKPITSAMLKKTIRKATLQASFFPVLCGSS
ncbi:translation elongation factor G, partial sequence, partial [Candidatus Phytoplasma solani]